MNTICYKHYHMLVNSSCWQVVGLSKTDWLINSSFNNPITQLISLCKVLLTFIWKYFGLIEISGHMIGVFCWYKIKLFYFILNRNSKRIEVLIEWAMICHGWGIFRLSTLSLFVCPKLQKLCPNKWDFLTVKLFP